MSREPDAKKPLPSKGRRFGMDGLVRPLLLSEQRQIAWDLHSRNLTYSQVAAQMGVSAIRARDLCRQFLRAQQTRSQHAFEHELSKRALMSLLNGKHGRKIVDKADRLVRLVEIAASYTREELQDERNVGRQTLREIEHWILRKGFDLRAPSQTVQDALENLRAKMHAARQRASVNTRAAPANERMRRAGPRRSGRPRRTAAG